MNPDLPGVWAKFEGMPHGLIVLLPNLGVALIAFALFYGVAKGVKSLVIRFTDRRRRHSSRPAR